MDRLKGGADRPRSEGIAEDVKERWKKAGMLRGVQGLYTLSKAAGGEVHDALPDRGAAKPDRATLGWKQERAALWPSARL